MITDALDSLMNQAVESVSRANGHAQHIEEAAPTVHQDEHEDHYVMVDALLLREPEDRTVFQMDRRSIRLRKLSTINSPWTGTSAASDLDNWSAQIGEHSQLIRHVASLNRPIITVRTRSTVPTGDLAWITRFWMW